MTAQSAMCEIVVHHKENRQIKERIFFLFLNQFNLDVSQQVLIVVMMITADATAKKE